MSQKIKCPNCNFDIDLDKIADEKYTKLIKEQEYKLKEEQEKQREQFEKELEEKTIEMRKKAQEFAEKKALDAKKEMELEMKDMASRLEKAENEQQEAKKKELEFIQKQRELENKEKNFELEMEKKLFEERKNIELSVEERLKENSKKEMDEKMEKMQEEFRKKELEYQKQQDQLKRSLDDAKRKAEQGSQQIQGDVQEDDLKNAIMQAFPIDKIDDVATGVKGADLVQTVKNNFGQQAGIIVWESKNTKAWSDSWVMKLKDDKLKINGNIAILVTTVLPKDMKNFGMFDDVMVCLPEFAIAVATMLRDKLLSISKVEKSLEGKDAKMEMLYKYLSSEEFSSKINMMVDVFSNLKAGIDSERRAMEKNWKRREKDLERATFAVTGMYGELESLMGQALPGAERLELGYGEVDYDLED
ncbi:MAG: DUF2130 domain-containing protein [Candidatus Gracilibacteria bacterium]|nr:DUF2130 domain-containing protein [Candidatus Gracilibacteria bacterium]